MFKLILISPDVVIGSYFIYGKTIFRIIGIEDDYICASYKTYDGKLYYLKKAMHTSVWKKGVVLGKFRIISPNDIDIPTELLTLQINE